MTAPNLAQQERGTICDLFVEYGADAPTLCEGWLAVDLAAHLVVRERRPDSGPGLVWPRLAEYTEKVRRAERDRVPFERACRDRTARAAVVASSFRRPMNTVEFFIHVEDLRRGRDGWTTRWCPRVGRRALGPGRSGRHGEEGPRHGRDHVAGPGHQRSGLGPRLELAGDPGELIMFGAGRQAAAKVEIDGDETLAAQLRGASWESDYREASIAVGCLGW